MLRSKRRRKTGPDYATQQTVWDRANHRRERCGVSAANHGGQIHHRLARSMGGSRGDWINHPTNLALLCAACHRSVEANPTRSKADGWKVSQWESPETVPMVNLLGERFIFDDDARVNL